MIRSLRRAGGLLALTASMLLALPGRAQTTTRPEPKPSPSPAAVGNSQTSQLPAGTDTGVPGTGQKPSLFETPTGDNTRSSVLRRRDADNGIDDGAAAKAARRPGRPASSASSPGPSPKRSPPSR